MFDYSYYREETEKAKDETKVSLELNEISLTRCFVGASSLGAIKMMLFALKRSITFAPTSAWMHVGRAMQEQLPRADAPTSPLSTHKLNSYIEIIDINYL